MQINADLISKGKGGTAQVIVRSVKPPVTRHVKLVRGLWEGQNPNPQAIALNRAAEDRLAQATEFFAGVAEELAEAQAYKEQHNDRAARERLFSAEHVYASAKQELDAAVEHHGDVQRDFPLTVEYVFLS